MSMSLWRALRSTSRWVGLAMMEIMLCILALAAWVVVASSAAAETSRPSLDVGFEVAWGEITLGEGVFRLSEGEARYDIEGEARTLGPMNFFYPWQGEFSVAGARDGKERSSELFQARSTSSRGQRETRIRYQPDAPAVVEVAAEPIDEPRTPVDPDEAAAGVDILTAFAQIFDRVHATKGEDCAVAVRVWDGVRLFEVESKTLGPGAAPQDRPWSYSGPTLQCGISFTRLGGFPTEGRWAKDQESKTSRVLHLAALNKIWTPVRLEISAPLGDVVARSRLD
ncbi:MAG: DUF3108 domain-containing protein [Rhodobacteraceae bacterium]|nr:DUF3108 domain-containing protein [Paracoccaceae bacterium]